MARMFCTLKEAAAWLATSESNLRTMLDAGVIPEFREGGSRLLRISDVRDFAASRSRHDGRQNAPGLGFADEHTVGHTPQEAPAPEIRLPRTGVALLEPASRDLEPLESWDATELSLPDELDWQLDVSDLKSDCQKPTRQTESTDAPPQWPDFAAKPRTTGRGLWIGIIDDRPMAILGVSALAIAIASALASAVYVLVRFLQ